MSEVMEKNFEKVCEIINNHNYDSSKLIPILQEVQEEYRYLPQEVMTFVATSLNISSAKVFGVASFYAHFTLEPKGKYVIKICDGTACHVKKSTHILEALQKRLGLKGEEQTTKDMLFTLETVSCLGACGLAPAIVINENVHGLMTPESAVAVIDEIAKEEGAKNV
jgi:NADH-quinone oxidoreductase subunit E